MSAPTTNPMPDNIDYAHTSNVARLHAAVAREKAEPVARTTPISLGIVSGIIALALIAGSYLGANKGSDFGTANIKGYFYPLKFDGAETSGTVELSPLELHQPETWLAMGKSVYSNNCVTCHTANGEGQAGLYPPLKASEFVLKGERRLVSILQHGVAGSLTVNGKAFNGQMQPLGAAMTPTQLGQLLSYVRNEWGNKASIIYDDQITALRKELGNRASYTEAELRAIPEDENAPPSKWPEELKKAAVPPAAGAPAPGAPAPGAPAPGAPAPGAPAPGAPAPGTPAPGTPAAAPAAGAPAATPPAAPAPAPAK